MFNFTISPTFKVKVAFRVPGGKTFPATFEFRYLDQDAIREYFDGISGKTDADALEGLLVGWDGLGEPYSRAALDELCHQVPSTAAQLFDAWRGELFEARKKN